ncbi:MAG: hypothetical protein ACXVAX_11885, partial [Pseudobdellovibrio sp.]
MPSVKVRLGLLDRTSLLQSLLSEQEPQLVSDEQLNSEDINIELLIINCIDDVEILRKINKLEKLNQTCTKIAILTEKNSNLNFMQLAGLRIDHFIYKN